MKNKIIIIAGDPNSINSEIIYKSWKKINTKLKKNIYFIGNFKLLKDQFRKLNYKIKISKVNGIEENNKSKNLKIININLKFKNPFMVPFKSSSNFVLKSLSLGHKLALKKNVKGIINCPINKNLLKKHKIGVTEYLAKKCKVKNNSEAMLIWNKDLSVCPITTHIDINEVSKKLNRLAITNKVKTIHNWYLSNLKKKPKIAVKGLNPHNAELRKNSEEIKIIKPSISKLKVGKIKIDGPHVSDTFFIKDFKKYDVIIGMYHDQVLTIFKSIYKFDAINITLGLKYLRVSPDHGTATNLISKKKANSLSLTRCIKFIDRFGK